jgi:NADH-quinone oxidoreductase subunit J
VASAVLVVAMRNPVHSALFLLVTFICVAVLFVIKSAEFVAAVQVLVYAGGIMVLFLFVVMLINVRHLPDERVLSSFWKGGFLVFAALFILFVAVVRPGAYHDPVGKDARLRVHGGNSQAVAMAMYTKYLVPFEVASLFLLVAMIGAIVIGKRELSAEEEDLNPQFILERVETEKEVKEAVIA